MEKKKKQENMANSSSEIQTTVLGTETDVGPCMELPPSFLNSKLEGALESLWNCPQHL